MVEVQAWTPVGLNPSRWCEDPFGRFELRWWDGTAWTARVRSDGWRATDPLGTAPPHTDTAQVAPRDPAQDATESSWSWGWPTAQSALSLDLSLMLLMQRSLPKLQRNP